MLCLAAHDSQPYVPYHLKGAPHHALPAVLLLVLLPSDEALLHILKAANVGQVRRHLPVQQRANHSLRRSNSLVESPYVKLILHIVYVIIYIYIFIIYCYLYGIKTRKTHRTLTPTSLLYKLPRRQA